MIELVVRLVFSLAVVIGLLLLLAKFSSRKFRGSTDALVRVVHRQALSRTSAVAVVTVGSRVLVLGTTEQHVQLLTELDADELDEPLHLPDDESAEADPESRAVADGVVRDLELAGRRTPAVTVPDPVAAQAVGPLAGSVLSAQTWKQALAAAEASRARLLGKERNAS